MSVRAGWHYLDCDPVGPGLAVDVLHWQLLIFSSFGGPCCTSFPSAPGALPIPRRIWGAGEEVGLG